MGHRYYGGWADKIDGKVIDTNSETFNYTKQEPVSIVRSTAALYTSYLLEKIIDTDIAASLAWCLWTDNSLVCSKNELY